MAAEGAAPPGPPKPKEVEYDENGEIIGAMRTPQQMAAQRRLQQQQAQVNEVAGLLKTNVEAVLKRDKKISEFSERADENNDGCGSTCHNWTNNWAAEGAGPPGPPKPKEVEYDENGEIIGAMRTPQQMAAQRRLQQQQAQVDEVVDIMKANVETVLLRDAKLSELDDRADALQQGASQFEQQAKSLKNKFWLQNLKMMIIMGVIGIVIIGVLFGDNIKQMFGNN